MQNSKRLIKFLKLLIVSILFSLCISCGGSSGNDNGDGSTVIDDFTEPNTIVGTAEVLSNQYMINAIEDTGFVYYTSNTPPEITGIYSSESRQIDTNNIPFDDGTFRPTFIFKNQNKNIIGLYHSDNGEHEGAITGEGNSFTVFVSQVREWDTDTGICTKKFDTLYTGTLNNDGSIDFMELTVVTECPCGGAYPSGSYQLCSGKLMLKDINYEISDLIEKDSYEIDSLREPSILTPTTPQERTFHDCYDMDFAVIEAHAGNYYTIKADGDGNMDMEIFELRDSGVFNFFVGSYGSYLTHKIEVKENTMLLVMLRETAFEPGSYSLSVSKEALPPDTDKDGVVDSLDACPTTPTEESAGPNGCSASQMNVDIDNDGVPDIQDSCSDTPAIESVDVNGCSASQVDTDNDGVVDNQDDCPYTSVGESSDLKGCSEMQSSSDYTNSLGMSFNLIPAGIFTMGSPIDETGRSNDEDQHEVTLTQSFYIQRTEVTQGQWKEIMGQVPGSLMANERGYGDKYPVYWVTWDNAQLFLTEINKRGEGIYRLPTEAEWEYTCRAGSATAFANGSMTHPNLDAMGWYWYNSDVGYGIRNTHPVAQKDPNEWGLYDMHGNVSEWCQDSYYNYPTENVTDPIGESGTNRILRGGDYDSYDLSSFRSAYRSSAPPGSDYFHYGNMGFRIVLDLNK